MTQVIVNQILSQLEVLEPEELQQLNQAIVRHLAAKEETVQQTTFQQVLLKSGLVKKLKPLLSNPQTERRLIQVQGQPVSETIIEERR